MGFRSRAGQASHRVSSERDGSYEGTAVPWPPDVGPKRRIFTGEKGRRETLMATSGQVLINKSTVRKRDPFGAFFWLSAFYLVYCARPEDWLAGIGLLPLAKITGIAAFGAFLFGAGKGRRKFSELPLESYLLLAMIVILMVSSMLSPIWKGGAI